MGGGGTPVTVLVLWDLSGTVLLCEEIRFECCSTWVDNCHNYM